MSRSALKGIQAAAGAAAGEATYVDDVFATHLYRGNGSTKTITNGIDVNGEGGLVWIKNLITGSGIAGHFLMDTVQPQVASSQAFISSNSDVAADGSSNMVSAFNSDGFSLGSNSRTNNSGTDYVSWAFRKAPGFLDIVTYTGNGTAGREISHNLGSKPGCVFIKRLDATRDWSVNHVGINGASYWLALNLTSAQMSRSDIFGQDLNNATSTTFEVGDTAWNNASGGSYVAYVFANNDQSFGEDEDEAVIKCGSYTGNGSSTGPTVDLGFEPQWLLIKKVTGSSEAWVMHDHLRGLVHGGADPQLQADATSAEWSGYEAIDLLGNGFQLTTSAAQYNENSQTYIYVAIRRPFKPASELNSVDLFKPIIYTGTGTQLERVDPPASPTNIDLMFFKSRSLNGRNWEVVTRLTASPWPHSVGQGGASPKGLHFNTSDAEADVYSFSTLDGRNIAVNQDGATNLNVNGENYSVCRFARAPGFFDVVAYTGTGSARTINHNLGAVPQLMFVKGRNASFAWDVYAEPIGNTKKLSLNSDGAASSSSSDYWNNTTPTDSVFSLGTGLSVNNNNSTFVAYLFGSVDGISKVGSYTGTGSDVNVDCGFSSGARFVMVKRTDSTGDWYVWDTARGIVSGNDGYLRFNLANDEDSGDWIDPLSSGFTITSSAPVALNANGGTYLFYAIA